MHPLEAGLLMVRARAMTAALDSGLIALLAEEPATAAQLSEQLALDPAGIAVILRVLTEDGVVTVRGAEFRLAPSTQAAALDEGLAPVLGFMGDQWEILSDLDEQLERPRDIHGRDLPPDFWQRYQGALAANAGETPAELAAALGADSSERVLDVGGGHGLFGSAWADCGATVTLMDQPRALEAAPPLDPRLSFIRADLRDGGAWGHGYTTILLINLVPHLSDPELSRTLHRARRSLAPGGRVVVQAPVPQPQMVGAASELLFYLMCGRRLRWPEALNAALVDAGFEDVEFVTLETTTAAVLVGRLWPDGSDAGSIPPCH